MILTSLTARTVLDSRGNPTVEVEGATANNRVRAIVPSGASTGVFEAKELRDGGKLWRGLGVSKAVTNVRLIAKQVEGKNYENQAAFDAALIALDGTPDKSKLGANAILGASMAFCRLEAAEKGLSLYRHIADIAKTKPALPVIYANVINGGKHSGNGLPMQEFMVVPRASSFTDAVQDIANTYHELKETIKSRYGGVATGVGDEGGFAPPVKTAEEALILLEDASKNAGTKMRFAIDAAASEFYNVNSKSYNAPQPVDAAALTENYLTLIKKYKVVSLEDPFEQHAFQDFATLRARIKKERAGCQIVADDLTVTNPTRIKQAIDAKSADCLLLKVNQIGSVTESLTAASVAMAAGWNVMVSHRSGETDDAFISHLAAGLGSGQIKIGAPCRGERVAKYNELIRISESLRTYAKD